MGTRVPASNSSAIALLFAFSMTSPFCVHAAANTECSKTPGSCETAKSPGDSGSSLLATRTSIQRAFHSDNETLDGQKGLAQKNFLARRAVFTRWGSRKCPFGSKLLYAGFMANSGESHSGGSFNYLCMTPFAQIPHGSQTTVNGGNWLYGVEYRSTGVLDKNTNKDAACAVCQYQNGAETYVEWGRGNKFHNNGIFECSKQGHETLYNGLVMASYFTHHKAESICVDEERAIHPASKDAAEDAGGLWITEFEHGAANEAAYPHNLEVGCTVCGIPALKREKGKKFQLDTNRETNVFTRWGARTCVHAHLFRTIYTGFMASSHYTHPGGGANSLCMTVAGAAAPFGYNSGNQNGNLLYGVEYHNSGNLDKNHLGDAACAVCEHIPKHQDVYTQWGRQSCSNGHTTLYKGLVMGPKWNHKRQTHLCVDERREVGAHSSYVHEHAHLLYTTKMLSGSSDEVAYPDHVDVGCAVCAGSPDRTIFTHWGSLECPSKSKKLYSGFMASGSHSESGGGSNVLCMHELGQPPHGADTVSTRTGNVLYGMEYQNTYAIDKNHDKDAACAVCELDRWEVVYTQWGRSSSCTNGHEMLYSGLVMSTDYTHQKQESVCVDRRSMAHKRSSNLDHNGGLLYTTEMKYGASDEAQYPSNAEVGCTVCAAKSQKDELPFALQAGNGLDGKWEKIRTLHTGQEVTVSYGYEASAGTSSSTEETTESSYTHVWDASICFTSTWQGGGFFSPVKVEKSLELCASFGGEKADSVAKTTATEAGWDHTTSKTMSDTFSVPDAPPDGTPQASIIQAHGVHLWQWQWTIVEKAEPESGKKERWYKAKANSHYVYSPNDPNHLHEPCCYPGQELGLWYPFHCKSEEGLMKGAKNAAHCHVGHPSDASAHIKSMTTQQVATWLNGLGLSQNYASKVTARGLNGNALATLARVVDKSSVASGSDAAAAVVELVAKTFDVGAKYGDAYIIMDGLSSLLASPP